MEEKRSTSIHLFGRHTVGGPHPNLTSKTFEHGGGRFDGSRIQIESQKKQITAKSVGGTFGISDQFSSWKTSNYPSKSQRSQKRTGQVCQKNSHVQKTSGSNFGPSEIKSGGNAFPQSIYRTSGQIFGRIIKSSLGFKTYNPKHNKGPIKRGQISIGKLVWKKFSPKSHQIFTFRQQYPWLGWSGHSKWKFHSGILEGHGGPPPLHINKKELIAAINTIKSLSKEGETVSLSVDNQVIYYYLTKGGGRENPFNVMLQPLYKWLMERNITLQVNWVPSKDCLADPISRWEMDREDYTLDPLLFHHVKEYFKSFIHLKTDLFASPGNKKMDQFVSRWPHWEAVAVDALQCPLDNLGDLYANPPWSVIEKFLPRLKQFPNAKVLMVLPYWDSATWWPQLIKMKIPKTPCLRVTPYRGMFKNCWGEEMPPQDGTSFASFAQENFGGETNSKFNH